jgi:hypothetical protein
MFFNLRGDRLKTSIWVRNVQGVLFEVTNSSDSFLILGEETNYQIVPCKIFDLLQYSPNAKPIPNTKSWVRVIHESDSKEESELIKSYIFKRLTEKKELLQERRALKKIKSEGVQDLIDNIDRQLRNEFFEINIVEITGGEKNG